MKGRVGVVVLLLLGCTQRMYVGDVKAAAARDLQCNADDISLDAPTEDQLRLLRLAGAPTHAYARGCGKRLVYARMCKADGSACAFYSVKKLRVDQLLERVAFDLRCDKAQITTSQLSASTVGVAACGQQATYVWSCPHNADFFSGACTWVLNSDSRPNTPSPAP